MSLELQNSLLPSHSPTEVSIQEILKVYFQNVINQIGFYEEKTRTEISHLKQSIETKDQLIQSSTEMNSKLKEEMQDFLKVSFANKWKVESEKLKNENEKLKEELKMIKKENTNLNQCIEKYLKEKDDDNSHSVSTTQQNTSDSTSSTSSIETQTEYICIQTQKAKYTLVDDNLMNGDKVIGKVIV